MQNAVSDLYSEVLLAKSMVPVFHSYYNIEYRDGFAMPVHSHGNIEIMYVRKGSCEVYVKEERYRLEVGDFILLNGYVPHRLAVNKNTPCKVLCLEFEFVHDTDSGNSLSSIYRYVNEVRSFLKEGRSVLKLKDTVEIYPILNDIYRELEESNSGKNIYVKSAFSQFFIKLARLWSESEKRGNSLADRYTKDAISFMSSSYYEELTIEQVSEHVNLNVSYFHKIFKQATGKTPMDFLNAIRINKAKMLLQKTGIPIIDICNYVGFNSRQYFSYAFKKQTGVTPSKFRSSLEAKGPLEKANSFCYEYMEVDMGKEKDEIKYI